MGREGVHENVTSLESIHLPGGFWGCYQELMWNVFFLVEVGGSGGFENALSHATYDSSVCFLSSRNKQIR